MTERPRRDPHHGQGRHRTVDCKCGAVLGWLTNSHAVFTLAVGSAAAFVPIGTARIELVCLACGAARYLRGDRLRAVSLTERRSA